MVNNSTNINKSFSKQESLNSDSQQFNQYQQNKGQFKQWWSTTSTIINKTNNWQLKFRNKKKDWHICQCNSRSWLNCFNDMTELSFLSQTFKNNIIKYLHNCIVWNKDVSCNSVKHDEWVREWKQKWNRKFP